MVEERNEKRAREKLRKEENQRIRAEKKENKELARIEREKKQQARLRRTAELEAEKARKQLERAIRPLKKSKPVKMGEIKYIRPFTPPCIYDSDSPLSSPSNSDREFAAFVENTPNKTVTTLEYLPSPAPTPQKPLQFMQAHSITEALAEKKRKYSGSSEDSEAKRTINSMSIAFLTQ
jgi:hypothetical protein